LSNTQVNNLIEKKEAANTFSLYSPYNGYLISNEQAPTTSMGITQAPVATGGAMNDGMGSTSQAATAPRQNASTIIREGGYVSAGQTLFRVVDNSRLRIELDLSAGQAGGIKVGDKLELDFGSGKKENAIVDFIQPFFNKGQDFMKLRVYTKKIEGLHIGQLVNGKITLQSPESLWVPKEAVLDLGRDKIVFVKEKGELKPKKISTGISAEGLIEIKSGLASSDEIAANAQYLVDSESFIKTVE
jgi:membrane fusion protein, copper/silver efflux system